MILRGIIGCGRVSRRYRYGRGGLICSSILILLARVVSSVERAEITALDALRLLVSVLLRLEPRWRQRRTRCFQVDHGPVNILCGEVRVQNEGNVLGRGRHQWRLLCSVEPQFLYNVWRRASSVRRGVLGESSVVTMRFVAVHTIAKSLGRRRGRGRNQGISGKCEWVRGRASLSLRTCCRSSHTSGLAFRVGNQYQTKYQWQMWVTCHNSPLISVASSDGMAV